MAFSTLTGAIRIDSSGVSEGVDDAEQSLDSFAGKAEAVGSRMQSAGKTLTMGVTAPLVAMGGMAAKQAANFDESMARSLSVMSDVSAAMEEDLRDTARRVARETTVSATEAADALYFLSSSGLTAAESMEAMPQVAAFSEAAGDALSMADAADAATNVMNAYGYEASEMGEVTDTLSAAVSSHNQTLEGMGSAMSQVAPVASSLGVSLEETSAAVGLLGDAGISAEKAGTGLRSILIGLSDEASPLNQQLQEMGVQTRNAQGDMLPLADILQNMRDAGIDASDASKLFTREASAAGATLLEQAGAFDSATQSIKDADGATEEMAETQRDTLNAELEIMRSNLEDAGITIGTVLLPMLSTLTGHVTTAAQRFQGLTGKQQKAIVVAGGFAAVLGPMLLLLGTAAQSVVALSGAYGVLTGVLTGGVIPAALATQVALGPITVPIWAIIGAIGALIGVAGALWYAWNNNLWGVRDTTVGAFNEVKGWFDAAPGWVLALLGPVGQMYYVWRENLFGVQDVVGSVFDWIGDKIGWLRDQIDRIPGIGTDDITPDNDEMEDDGSNAGSSWEGEFERNANPVITPETDDEIGDGPIKGKMTPEIRAALEEGVDGYVSDPDEIEDAPTEINEDLYEAVRDGSGVATAETLGVSEKEFATLLQRFEGGGAAGPAATAATGGSGTSTSSAGGGSGTGAGSTGLSASEFKTALREVLDGMRLDTRLETDQRGLEKFIEEIAKAQFREAAQGGVQ